MMLQLLGYYWCLLSIPVYRRLTLHFLVLFVFKPLHTGTRVLYYNGWFALIQWIRLYDRNICLFGLFYYHFALSLVVPVHDEVIKQTKETNVT